MPQAVDEAGNIWETDAQGNPTRFVGKVGGPAPVTLGRPNATKQRGDELSNISKQLEIEARRLEMAERNKPKLPVGYRMKADGSGAELIPGVAAPGSNAKGDPGKVGAYDSVIKQIDRLYELYNQGIGQTSGIAGILDYLPTDANAAFDTAGAALGDQGNAAFKVPGMGAQSDADAARFVAANQPQASDRDVAALEKLRALRQRLESNMAAQGLPLPKWNYDLQGNPIAQQNRQELPGAVVGSDGVQRSQQVGAQYSGGTGGGAIATGDNKDIAIPAEMQAELEAFLRANPRGKLDPNAYAAKRLELNAKYGFGISPADLQTYLSEGKAYNEQLNRPFNMTIPPVKGGQTSVMDRAKGAFVTNPAGAAVTNFANANMLGIPGAFSGGAIDAIREESPRASMAGDIAGSLTGIAGLAKGAMKAGLAKDLPQALLRSNLVYGTTKGASEMPENPLLGGAVGLATAGAGEGIGRGVVAPAVSAIARSRGGQAVGNTARGIFGKRQMPVVDPLSQGDQMIVSAVGDRGAQTMGKLREAARLNLPFTLADANPNLRALAGSAVRKSPAVRQTAEDVLRPRAMGQIDRLQGAISRDFGDPTNILTRSDELMTQARTASRPFYEQAFSAPGASSVGVDDILNTPLGQEALQRARTQAMNDKMDPTALGFDLNDQGEVILTRVPSFKTLDYVKRSFDDIANEGKTPFGTFQPNQSQATAANLAGELRGRGDAVNPAYGQARAAYAGPAGEREALNMGAKAPSMSADKVRYTLGNLGGNKPDQYRLGALSAISERANNINYSRNPYDAIAGSPEARARLSVLWPQTAPRFARQADLEGEMSRTFTEALGGSQTAARGAADEAFDASPGAAMALDATAATLAGAPPVATLSRLGSNFLKDSYRLGIGQAKANQIGPVLLNPDAAQAAAIFADIRKNAMNAGMLGKKAKKQGQTVGDITASFMAPITSSYLLGQ